MYTTIVIVHKIYDTNTKSGLIVFCYISMGETKSRVIPGDYRLYTGRVDCETIELEMLVFIILTREISVTKMATSIHTHFMAHLIAFLFASIINGWTS